MVCLHRDVSAGCHQVERPWLMTSSSQECISFSRQHRKIIASLLFGLPGAGEPEQATD